MNYTISKEDMAILLGRPLSEYEITAYESLLASAKQNLDSQLGSDIDGVSGKILIELYPGVITPLPYFVKSDRIEFFKRDDSLLTHEGIYALNSNLNSDICNRVIFTQPDRRRKPETFVLAEANWGFGDELPSELKLLWARLFEIASQVAEMNTQKNVKSETILSHRVDFVEDQSLWEKFANDNADVINKWRQAPIAVVEGY